jgi:DNA-binding IclR family transcriptional regulator
LATSKANGPHVAHGETRCREDFAARAMPMTEDTMRRVPPRSTARLALKILELFSPAEPVLGVSEIGRRLGIHKSNVSRLVAALQSEGFLARTEAGRYTLGLRLFAMGTNIPRSHVLYQAALLELCELRSVIGESAHLATLVGTDVIHIERLHSERLMKRVLSLKMNSPTHATSTGKVLLAHSPEELGERVIALGLRRHTSRTVTNPTEFRLELATVRATGYAVNREEFRYGTSSVAVPIIGADGRAIAAIAIVAPCDRLAGYRMANALLHLQKAGDRITRMALHG